VSKVFQKLTTAQPLQKFPVFHGPQVPRSQQPTTGCCPEPAESSEYADIQYIYGFYGGNSNTAVEYRERFPNRQIPYRQVFGDRYQRLLAPPAVVEERILDLVQHSQMICDRRMSNRPSEHTSRARWLSSATCAGSSTGRLISSCSIYQGTLHATLFRYDELLNFRVNNTRHSHLLSADNPHDTVKSTFQH
jgi:hypothetical protein